MWKFKKRTNKCEDLISIQDMGNSYLFFLGIPQLSPTLDKCRFPIFCIYMQQIFDISTLSKSKKKLLETCIVLLSDHQWSEISIDQIEDAIHKTRGAIFHHYKTKDELFTNTILYFFSYCQMIKKSDEGLIQTVLSVLKEKYKITNPELSLFNILVQAVLKEKSIVKDFISTISSIEVNWDREKEISGHAFVKVLID